jgi:prolyl-tRNA synthetase
MRMSKYFLKTLREAPSDAELESHKLLLRAGLAHALAAGLYSFTPLGYRVVRKIENIIREEMDRGGAQELHLPALHPAELWEKSGRSRSMNDVLFRVSDRRDREFVLGPTHEEVISSLAAGQIQSYRDLPVTLYQIQTKFRDERRPRGGLIRVREFEMKDAYSFDPDWESLDESYKLAYDAYERIFRRVGLPAVPVAADSGAIGGKDSEEFIYITPVGEDEILICPECNYAANAEKAAFVRPDAIPAEPGVVERVDTPGQKTIADLASFLDIDERQTLKAVFYEADGKPVLVAIRGDLEVNEVKLANALKAATVEPMEDHAVRASGLVAGSAGPVNIEGMTVVADESATEAVNLVTGANEADVHLVNTNFKRDWDADVVADVSLARGGDQCPNCAGVLAVERGVELAHVFKLGTMYSDKMGVNFLDESGKQQPVVMGCYGLGIDRMLASIIEEHHDDDGIIWPTEIAPFDVHVVGVRESDEEVAAGLNKLERKLEEAGYSVLLDDRAESPGAKFKDADLIGLPVRITVSPRSLKAGGVEFKLRSEGESVVFPLDKVVEKVGETLRA